MILCASELRSDVRADVQIDPNRDLGTGAPDVGGVVTLADGAEFDGVALGAHGAISDLGPLVAAAASARLSLPVVAAPLSEGRLAGGRRMPYLATLDDDDERRAAVTLFRRVLEAAVPLGVSLYSLNLGAVTGRVTPAAVARRFARRELEEDEPGVALWNRALAERRAMSGRVQDACRYALDRIVPLAEHHGVTLALEIAGGPWGIPSPREASDLLAAYREAPLRITWDDARMQVLRTLGLAPAAERVEALVAATALWRAHEAVGLETGYLPGLGDPDSEAGTHLRAACAAAKGPLATIIMGRRDSTPAEVARARALVGDALRAAATPLPDPLPATRGEGKQS